MNKKLIFLRDPWNDVKNHDSGWGNRLLCWEVVNIINRSLGGTHVIKVLPKEYPELTIVDFPNTKYINLKEVKLTPITSEMIIGWIKNKKIELNPELSYTTCYSFKNATEFAETFFNEEYDSIPKLQLKNKKLDTKLRLFFKDKIGIHIRRGNGVHLDNYDKFTIPRGYMKYYKLCPECDKAYPFIRDEIYFNIIDNFLKKDKDVKFFIGIDVDENAIAYYKEKYRDKIITCKDVIKDNKKLLEEIKFLEPRLQLPDMGKIILDFFSLAYCQKIIPSPASSWSYIATRILGEYKSFTSFYKFADKLNLERNKLVYSNNNYNGYKKQHILKSNII